MGRENLVWDKPIIVDSRYPIGHYENNWDHTSWAGCFMQRRSNDYSSEFTLKNAVEYEVAVGYNIYDGASYSLDYDDLVSSKKQPLFSAESKMMKFYWWNIDGASGLVASAAALVALQFF